MMLLRELLEAKRKSPEETLRNFELDRAKNHDQFSDLQKWKDACKKRGYEVHFETKWKNSDPDHGHYEARGSGGIGFYNLGRSGGKNFNGGQLPKASRKISESLISSYNEGFPYGLYVEEHEVNGDTPTMVWVIKHGELHYAQYRPDFDPEENEEENEYYWESYNDEDQWEGDAIELSDKHALLKFILKFVKTSIPQNKDTLIKLIDDCRKEGYDYPEFKSIEKSLGK